MDDYPQLRLENQLCFPLYAAAKEMVRRYTPLLSPYGLTYTHYITMMVLWEKGGMSVNELGKVLHLDSGTLTPVLKRLESNGYVARTRSLEDERVVVASATEKGMELRRKLRDVPEKIGCSLKLSPEEAKTLYVILYKTLQ